MDIENIKDPVCSKMMTILLEVLGELRKEEKPSLKALDNMAFKTIRIQEIMSSCALLDILDPEDSKTVYDYYSEVNDLATECLASYTEDEIEEYRKSRDTANPLKEVVDKILNRVKQERQAKMTEDEILAEEWNEAEDPSNKDKE